MNLKFALKNIEAFLNVFRIWFWILKKELQFVTPFKSGYQDSNLGPPAPKAGALTGLRYIPITL